MRTRQIPSAMLLLAALATSAGARAGVDPTTVRRSPWPHDALACPKGACSARADIEVAVFAQPPDALLRALERALTDQPRTRITAINQAAGLIQAEAQSRVFGFIDDVAVRILPFPNGRSSFAVYSRARLGLYDLGVNARRVRALVATVEGRLGPEISRPAARA